MAHKKFHSYLHQQILILLGLSLFPGLGYIFLGWLNHIILPALFWYAFILLSAVWGYKLHKTFNYATMSHQQLQSWYQELTWFFYLIFLLWTIIFILYAGETSSKLHYIAIFTQLGASVVASALLFSDRKLYVPTISILMVPLIIYFALIHEWYSYVLSLFSLIFMVVLIYAANSSNKLLLKTDYQALHDQLTGLYNRNHFIDYLQLSLNRLKIEKQFSYLLLIDLDHFKTINDSLGHDIGDQLLIAVASRMQAHISNEHTLARLGGDEFIIIGPNFDNEQTCQQSALLFSQQLLATIKANYTIKRHHLHISASIGINLLSSRDIKASVFVKEADIAMYEVKASGRDGVILFDNDFSKKIEKHLDIERLLHFALQKDEIELNYQPQYNCAQQIIGCEVLVRWQNSELGYISPAEFIPIAEQTGFIIELGTYIVEQALATLHRWEAQGISLQQFSINISMRQIFHYGFVPAMKNLCQKYHANKASANIVFELTETIVAEDIKKLIISMKQLKEFGLHFSMDDFGTGYSSLSYITQLPIDELKIDRFFVSHLNDQQQNKAMVITILNMARTFALRVVAEGVESEAQMQFLIDNHCDVLQGFYFSPAVTAKEFEQLYQTSRQ